MDELAQPVKLKNIKDLSSPHLILRAMFHRGVGFNDLRLGQVLSKGIQLLFSPTLDLVLSSLKSLAVRIPGWKYWDLQIIWLSL
jgi:hypothetical protein